MADETMTREEQFEIFWRAYPRRVAKGTARKAFEKAIKKTTLENMGRAIRDYIARKPERIDFKHPATWLNGECWSDEWPAPVTAKREGDMSDFLMRRQESRNVRTIDAEYTAGGHRGSTANPMEGTSPSWRH